jgi:hypothetical protein
VAQCRRIELSIQSGAQLPFCEMSGHGFSCASAR